MRSVNWVVVLVALSSACASTGKRTTPSEAAPKTNADDAVSDVGNTAPPDTAASAAPETTNQAGISARLLATLPTGQVTLTTLPGVSWRLQPDANHCGGQVVTVSVATGAQLLPEVRAFVTLAEPPQPFMTDAGYVYLSEQSSLFLAAGKAILGTSNLQYLATAVDLIFLLVNRQARILVPAAISAELEMRKVWCDAAATGAEAGLSTMHKMAAQCREASVAAGTTAYDVVCAE